MVHLLHLVGSNSTSLLSGQEGRSLPVELVLGDHALGSESVELLDLVGDAESGSDLLLANRLRVGSRSFPVLVRDRPGEQVDESTQ